MSLWNRLQRWRCSPTNVVALVVGTKDGAGAIIWQVELPGSLGEPSFADVDGDGKGEVLVVCGDGNLYCLDREPD